MRLTPTIIWYFFKSTPVNQIPKKFYIALLNDHPSIFHLIAAFIVNFAPVALWLALFKNAALIPISWRPCINVKWLPLADAALFNTNSTAALFFLPLYTTTTTLLFRSLKISNKLFHMLIILSIPILNILHFQVSNFNKSYLQDIITYTSYVLLHLIIPIITAIYLYACHIPGILSLYGRCLGLQNIASITTHILLPSSPPWFVHINGLNATADYSTLGYAAELARIDTQLGWHLVSNQFHKSPIVFGAFPSVHSGMAVTTFLFLSWFSTLRTLQFLATLFVVLQWWSTIYLDHHWRLDLLAGATYSLTAFIILRYIWPEKFSTVEKQNYNKLSLDLELQALNDESDDDSHDDIDDDDDEKDFYNTPFLQRFFLNA